MTKDYDDALGMVIEKPRALNLNHLEFLRHLVVSGRLEHAAAGDSDGPVVALLREAARTGAGRP